MTSRFYGSTGTAVTARSRWGDLVPVSPIFNVPIDIQRQTLVSDEYGDNRQGAWATVYSVLGWADTNLKKETENIQNRDASNSDGLCFLPTGTDILDTDRLLINGFTYQVYGVPAPINDPRDNSTHHLELRIRRYVG